MFLRTWLGKQRFNNKFYSGNVKLFISHCQHSEQQLVKVRSFLDMVFLFHSTRSEIHLQIDGNFNIQARSRTSELNFKKSFYYFMAQKTERKTRRENSVERRKCSARKMQISLPISTARFASATEETRVQNAKNTKMLTTHNGTCV